MSEQESINFFRRATDDPSYRKEKSLHDYIDQIMVGSVGIILLGLGWLIKDFSTKVDRLADKVSALTEVMVTVRSDQANDRSNFNRLDGEVKEHFKEDRERFARHGIVR